MQTNYDTHIKNIKPLKVSKCHKASWKENPADSSLYHWQIIIFFALICLDWCSVIWYLFILHVLHISVFSSKLQISTSRQLHVCWFLYLQNISNEIFGHQQNKILIRFVTNFLWKYARFIKSIKESALPHLQWTFNNPTYFHRQSVIKLISKNNCQHLSLYSVFG